MDDRLKKFAAQVRGPLLLSVLAAQLAAASPREALWVWNTDQLVARPDLRDTLLLVRDSLKVRDVFLYLPHRFVFKGDSLSCLFQQEDSLIATVRWASEHGFRVYALAGEPEWSLPSYRRYAEAFVRAVLDLNRRPPDALFSGIHLDVEPYLLIQFASPVLRTRLYESIVQLHKHLAGLVHADPVLEYGADVPFWMIDSVRVDGRIATVAELILRSADHVAVLVYRDHAEGPNGIVELAARHVVMAEKLGKRIYLGIETQELRFQEFRFILGRSEQDFRTSLEAPFCEIPWKVETGERVAALDVFGSVHVGIQRSAPFSELVRIALCLGNPMVRLDTVFVHRKLDDLRFWARNLGEWENPHIDTVIELKGKLYQVVSMSEKPLPRVTFFEESFAELRAEMEKVDSAFVGHPGFGGIAVHDFAGAANLILRE
ncbi:MAG TPA: hypothetical protein VIH68_02020 [Bacteroidota bacterium]